jgi:hypothetical protein
MLGVSANREGLSLRGAESDEAILFLGEDCFAAFAMTTLEIL